MKKKKQSKNSSKLFHKKRKQLNTHTQFIGLDIDDYPVCLLSKVDTSIKNSVEKHNQIILNTNDWIISAGQCNSLDIYGPFQNKAEALKFGFEVFHLKRIIAT